MQRGLIKIFTLAALLSTPGHLFAQESEAKQEKTQKPGVVTRALKQIKESPKLQLTAKALGLAAILFIAAKSLKGHSPAKSDNSTSKEGFNFPVSAASQESSNLSSASTTSPSFIDTALSALGLAKETNAAEKWKKWKAEKDAKFPEFVQIVKKALGKENFKVALEVAFNQKIKKIDNSKTTAKTGDRNARAHASKLNQICNKIKKLHAEHPNVFDCDQEKKLKDRQDEINTALVELQINCALCENPEGVPTETTTLHNAQDLEYEQSSLEDYQKEKDQIALDLRPFQQRDKLLKSLYDCLY